MGHVRRGRNGVGWLLSSWVLGVCLAGCTEPGKSHGPQAPTKAYAIQKTEEEWKRQLSVGQYNVLRLKGTEWAFSGKYWNTHAEGLYVCAACGHPLFSSETKFDSETGWPSFWQPLSPDAVEGHEERSMGMTRTEVVCAHCGSHLGHVFTDGPKPTGLRYCMNSLALDFRPK